MPNLFTSNPFLTQQLGSIGSLTSDMERLSQVKDQMTGWGSDPTGMTTMPSFTDTGLASTMLPGQKELGGISKESWFGSSGGGIQKERGADLFGGMPSYGSQLSGFGNSSVGSFGGQQAMLNQYDAAFAAAGARYGIDPNWLKSIAAIEGHYDNGVDQYGAVGIMGIMPNGYQELQQAFPGWQSDPSQNIMLGAAILADKIRANGGTIEGGIQGYLGWDTDAYGTTPGSYLQRAQQYYQQLTANGGQFSGGGADGTISSMFGQGAAVHDWGEFGAESGNGLYGYGTQYGLNGTQHTGVDVAMPVGSPFTVPMGGTVVCGGTGQGSGAEGRGCNAFNDTYGSGAGRIEVLLDNGVTLIFGHSSQSFVRPGQRIDAGTVLGLSGGMNSPHIHLEARVRDPNTPSGWRIVDPRTVLGGGGMSPGMLGGGLGGGMSSRGGGNSLQALLARVRNWQ